MCIRLVGSLLGTSINLCFFEVAVVVVNVSDLSNYIYHLVAPLLVAPQLPPNQQQVIQYQGAGWHYHLKA